MSWDLAVSGKSVGIQVGTNLGLYAMAQYCRKKGGRECRAFFDKGSSKHPQKLRAELQSIIAKNDVPSNIDLCINALIDGLRRRRAEVSLTQ